MKHVLMKAVVGCAAILFFCATGFAEDDYTLGLCVSQQHFDEMAEVVKELAFNGVQVNHVAPDKAASLEQSEFAAFEWTPDSPVARFLDGKLEQGDLDELQKEGGKRLIILPSPFVNGQEFIVWAGHTEEDAAAIRKAKRNSWWSLMCSWFVIPTDGLAPY